MTLRTTFLQCPDARSVRCMECQMPRPGLLYKCQRFVTTDGIIAHLAQKQCGYTETLLQWFLETT